MSIVIAVPKEIKLGELRTALPPALVNKLLKLGVSINIQSGAGDGIYANDSLYRDVVLVSDVESLYASGDIILKVQPPTESEVALIKENSILISFLYPQFNLEVVKKLVKKKITSFAMELIPRISRAQDIDALSSQATIIGYKAALLAADNCRFFFPMLTTAAGSIRPAKVFVVGVGVAGLQAIATAKRLGAQVSAYDVRHDTKEQAESLGAKFLDVDLKAEGEGGYARELTSKEQDQQGEVLKKHIAGRDVIITTAGIPGKPAPKIISKEMIELMKPGSVVVDTLAEMGGNCELTIPGKTVNHNGVTIIGSLNLPSLLAINASEMYAHNLINFLTLIIKDGVINLDWNDEIILDSIVTHDGVIRNEAVRKFIGE